MFTVALVGRPNVGKSTLFNRLVGKKIALVDDRPGVTRDRREGFAKFDDFHFRLFDTAGFEDVRDDSLESRMRMQTEAAFLQADAIALILDARAGVTPIDEVFARLLRRSGRPVLLIANKAESRAAQMIESEALRLGFGEPILISAEHGEGIGYLLEDFRERAEKIGKSTLNNPGAAPKRNDSFISDMSDEEEAEFLENISAESDEDIEEDAGILSSAEEAAASGLDFEWVDAEGSVRVGKDRPLRIAVIGRPNAGKSTLINSILGEDRLLTGPEAGITRDSIGVDYMHEGKLIRIFDTAGVRRKSKVVEKLEKLSVADTLRAVRFAEIVIMLLDAENPFDKQDLQLIELVEREGRAVVLAINKWDIVTEQADTYTKLLQERVKTLVPQLRGLKPVFISGLSGRGIDRLFRSVFSAYEVWNGRVPTGALNQWLSAATQAHPPPLVAGRRVRIKYMTQIKTRPPTFVGFSSRAEKLPASYKRYLVNGVRQAFDLPATPIRLSLRKTANPFDR